MLRKNYFTFLLFIGICSVLLTPASSYSQVKLTSAILGGLEARQIGPAVMSGRITCIKALESESRIIYVGTASGGLWKSITGGTLFKPIFDKYCQSIGDMAIDNNNENIIWVGTGESNMRNSVSVGTGIYKSVDAGDNWELMGLELTEHISKVVINPNNSNVVYAAACGPLWGDSEHRGLYKTSDGGKTWNKILYINETTGCADVMVNPKNPDIIYAAMWQFRRMPWAFSSGGEGSGLYKSIDGGVTWKRIDSQFSEDGILGRICLALAPSVPDNIYAIVESQKTALYNSTDGGESWIKTSSTGNVTARPFYFSQIDVDPTDPKRVYRGAFGFSISNDGGKSFSDISYEGGWVHSDFHALWINPKNSQHLYVGTDAGVYMSLDRGYNWIYLNNIPASQFYHVSHDSEEPYNVMGGLQDNGSWIGPSQSRGGINESDWKSIGGGDGFWVFRDRENPDYFYWEYQGGNIYRYNSKTQEYREIKPCPMPGEPKLRFNWNTPIHLSPNDASVIYIGAQYLYRSSDKGESWERISPDLTTNDPVKQKQEVSGGLSVDNSSAENHCTIFTISESPKNSELLWVGTDDGNVQVTVNGGKSWTNVAKNIPGLPACTWCSSIEASPHNEKMAFASFDGHMWGDMNVYIYKTTDLGKTWNAIHTSEIKGFVHKIKQDPVNNNLLFAGTEFGLFVSINGGTDWTQFTANVPNVPVRDIVIHPKKHDLILATHGRGIIIVDDITPLRSLNETILNSEAAILPSRPVYLENSVYGGAWKHAGEFVGPNMLEEYIITYYLKERTIVGDLKIEIYDSENKLIKTLSGSKRKGINRVNWDMRLKPPRVAKGTRLDYGGFVGPLIPEGNYTIKLIKGDKIFTSKIALTANPDSPYSSDDRKLRDETIMKLYTMQEDLAYIAEVNSKLQEQITESSAKTEDESLKTALNVLLSKLDSLRRQMVISREGTGILGDEMLRERLGGLYSTVAELNGRPTDTHLQMLKAVEYDFKKTSDAQNVLLKKDLTILNELLQKAGLNKLVVLSREEFDKTESK